MLAHIVLCLFTMIKVLKSNSSTLYKISESLPTMFPEFPVLKFSELSLLISLQEKVTPKGWPFCYQDPHKFQILKCLLSWRHLYQNLTLDTAILKLYLVVKSVFCDVIYSNWKLSGSRETSNWLGILYEVSKMYFFQAIIHYSIFRSVILGVWSSFGSKKHGSRTAIN